jgi:hypothetical protein
MAGTCGLLFYAILSVFLLALHTLSAALPNLIQSASLTLFNKEYNCDWMSGVLVSNIIAGDCPLGYESDGVSTIDYLCGDDNENAGEEECKQGRGELGGICIAFGMYLLISVISLFMLCMGGGAASRRAFFLLSAFSLLATLFSATSLLVFYDRTAGDEYGCEDAGIPWLGGVSGENCYIHGPGYYIHVVSIFLSFVHMVCLMCSGCRVEKREQMIPVYATPLKNADSLYASRY